MKKKLNLILVTDVYWPAQGGQQDSVHSLACALGISGAWTITVVAHTNVNMGDSLAAQTVLLPSFSGGCDDAGNPVQALTPGLIQRLVLSAAFIWHVPLMRRFFAKKLYDLLYIPYRVAFRKQLSTLLAGADIVHCFSTRYLAMLCADVCKTLCKPLVQTPYVHFGQWGDTPLLFRAYCSSQAVVVPTEAFKKEFSRRCTGLSVDIVVNPPLSHRTGQIPDSVPGFIRPSLFILFLGRREKHKGLDALLDAFVHVEEPAWLVIAGPGERRENLPPRCIDLGEVDEGAKKWLLSHCDIFCAPSYSETFGIVYAEAMAYARPVIALDVSPVNEVVVHGETGLLVPQNDQDSLVRALRTLCREGALRTSLGAAGKKRYDTCYAEHIVLAAIEGLYSRLIAEQSPGSK